MNALALPPYFLARLRGYRHERRTRHLEMEHLQEFQKFYRGLPEKRNLFFMFFTSGLLHWVSRTLSFVPPGTNVVLLGSHLTEEEQRWILENIDRPFHHIRLWTDDKTAWEFLFATCEHNFGWLDVDCLVLNPELFREMTEIEPDVVANCIWTFQGPNGVQVPATYFLFLNAEVIRAVRKVVPVSPTTYSYKLMKRPGLPRDNVYAFSRVPSLRQIRLLRQILPARNGWPTYLTELSEPCFFDTLQVYQVFASALGYRLHRVRPFSFTEQISSDEVVHVGKVSYYQRYKRLRDARLMKTYATLAQTDYVLLSDIRDGLPPSYEEMRRRIEEDLHGEESPANLNEIRQSLGQAMIRSGAKKQTVEGLLGSSSLT